MKKTVALTGSHVGLDRVLECDSADPSNPWQEIMRIEVVPSEIYLSQTPNEPEFIEANTVRYTVAVDSRGRVVLSKEDKAPK